MPAMSSACSTRSAIAPGGQRDRKHHGAASRSRDGYAARCARSRRSPNGPGRAGVRARAARPIRDRRGRLRRPAPPKTRIALLKKMSASTDLAGRRCRSGSWWRRARDRDRADRGNRWSSGRRCLRRAPRSCPGTKPHVGGLDTRPRRGRAADRAAQIRPRYTPLPSRSETK